VNQVRNTLRPFPRQGEGVNERHTMNNRERGVCGKIWEVKERKRGVEGGRESKRNVKKGSCSAERDGPDKRGGGQIFGVERTGREGRTTGGKGGGWEKLIVSYPTSSWRGGLKH